MRQLILCLSFIFTINLPSFSQIIWEESFHIPGLGIVGNASGEPVFYRSEYWTINPVGCSFDDENDYAMTVSTGGGRFEVLDSDGEIVFYSPLLDISETDAVRVTFDAGETGSSQQEDKKYVKPFLVLNELDTLAFIPGECSGNWGAVSFSRNGISGQTLQLIVGLNSSYANDKVFIDNLLVEAIDSSVYEFAKIEIVEAPQYCFEDDTALIIARALNKSGEIFDDSTLQLSFKSDSILTLSQEKNSGIYSWKIVSRQSGKLTFSICTNKENIICTDSSITFFDMKERIFYENFEKAPGDAWNLGYDWVLSPDAPIAGNYSLKHHEVLSEGRAAFSYAGHELKLDTADYLLTFKVRNLNWDPSSSNHFYIVLKDSNTADFNGYALGVNAKGNRDFLSVWTFTKGEVDELICESDFDWDAGQTALISIHRKAAGAWTLTVNDLDSGERSSVVFQHDEFLTIEALSFYFNYTSSYAGDLRLDDFMLVNQGAAPFVKEVGVFSPRVLNVVLNKPVDPQTLTMGSFYLNGANGAIDIDSIRIVDLQHILLYTQTIASTNLELYASGITDFQGRECYPAVFQFDYVFPAAEYDVAINEIMFDPSPSQGLPDAEYVEIFNRSNKFIQLQGWKLFVRNSTRELPPFVLEPGAYAVLANREFSGVLAPSEHFIPFDNFPNLLNDGTVVKLLNDEGLVVDELRYCDDWFNIQEKKYGGFSLEKIDVDRFCGNALNWKGCVDLFGGTPALQNSVSAENPDTLAPVLMEIDVEGDRKVNLIFDEALDSFSVSSGVRVNVPGLYLESMHFETGSTELALYFKEAFGMKKTYALSVSGVADECANIASTQTKDFTLVALSAGDILINEVLFNPFPGGVDFVELYNCSGVPVDLADLKIAGKNEYYQVAPVYDVSDKHQYFENEQYLVLTSDTQNIRDHYYVPIAGKLLQLERLPAYSDSRGTVVLLNDSMEVIDEFAYSSSMHSGWLSEQNGVSLERLSFSEATNDPGNWQSASSMAGFATPGYANSQQANEEKTGVAIELASDLVSPNGDAYNDELIITFVVNGRDYLVNLYIFNAQGIEVKRLLNNELPGKQHEICYDLRKSDGSLLPMGTYLLFAEFINLKTERKVIRKAFHVTDLRR